MLAALCSLYVLGMISGKDSEAVDEADNIVQPTEKVKGSSKTAAAVDDTKLDLARLHREEVTEVKADLFAAKSIYPEPPPVPAPVAVAPSAPSLPFSFIGKFIDGEVVTVFINKNNQDYSVRLNDVVDNTYRVEKISDDRVVFTYLPLDIQQTLNISRMN